MKSAEHIWKKQDLKKQVTKKIFAFSQTHWRTLTNLVSVKTRKQIISRNGISFEKSDTNEIYNPTVQIEHITNKIFII
jgi:hypothetical protein